jgi:hypothetical protein
MLDSKEGNGTNTVPHYPVLPGALRGEFSIRTGEKSYVGEAGKSMKPCPRRIVGAIFRRFTH